jgi:flagellar biosynthesis protein FlhG
LDKIVLDQAEGLRRLLARDVSRIVSVVGGVPGAGTSSAVANLASALAYQGKDVLVIDESAAGSSSMVASPGIAAAGSLAAVLAGMPLDQAVGRTPDGVAVLPAPRDTIEACPPAELSAALNGFADIILIDAALDSAGGLSPLAMQAHDVVIAMRVDAASITGAYACVKRLHYAHAIQQFRVLINGVASASDAQSVYQNLSGVANRYLAVSLSPAGAISLDVRLARAQQLCRSVVEAFPAAAAAVDYRRVAGDLLHWPWRPVVAPIERSRAPVRMRTPSTQPA